MCLKEGKRPMCDFCGLNLCANWKSEHSVLHLVYELLPDFLNLKVCRIHVYRMINSLCPVYSINTKNITGLRIISHGGETQTSDILLNCLNKQG